VGGGRGEVQGICASGAQAQWLWALAVVAGGRAVADWGGRRTPVRLCGGAVGDGAGGGGWGVGRPGRGCVVWLGAGALGSWVRAKGFGLVGWATINE